MVFKEKWNALVDYLICVTADISQHDECHVMGPDYNVPAHNAGYKIQTWSVPEWPAQKQFKTNENKSPHIDALWMPSDVVGLVYSFAGNRLLRGCASMGHYNEQRRRLIENQRPWQKLCNRAGRESIDANYTYKWQSGTLKHNTQKLCNCRECARAVPAHAQQVQINTPHTYQIQLIQPTQLPDMAL